MQRTSTYRFPYAGRGNVWGATSDFRRFVTLDYNLQKYVGILGNGILTGWDISSVSGLKIMVSPGTGFISGLYSETPYYLDPVTKLPKKKSEAVLAGDTIIEEMLGWSSQDGSWEGEFYSSGGMQPDEGLVFKSLGPSKNQDVVIPYFQALPEGYLDDPYVKAQTLASVLTLADNSDSYIYVERVSNDPLDTFVNFLTFASSSPSGSRIYLGKVVTRNGYVSKIDASSADRLAGMESTIKALAANMIQSHRHGGPNDYDPPHIQLKTDIRTCTFSSYSNDGKVTYSAFPYTKTSSVLNHSHSYVAGSDGAGYTVAVNGDYEFHWHDISNFSAGSIHSNYGSLIPDHVHSIPEASKSWSSSDKIKVYVNGVEISPNSYTTSPSSGTITFKSGVINLKLPTYKSTFAVEGETYSFEQVSFSLKRFLLSLNSNFATWSSAREQKAFDAGSPILIRDPFLFWNSNASGRNIEETLVTNDQAESVDEITDYVYVSSPVPIWEPIVSLGDVRTEEEIGIRALSLDDQIAMAQQMLKKAGDVFTFTPYAAKYIPITMVSAFQTDRVEIEILGNVEVTGSLKLENIFFVRAEKILTGELDVARIPFLSHVGRLMEPFDANAIQLQTVNQSTFYPSPWVSLPSMGHSHRVYVDKKGDGTTLATLVNNKIAVWVEDEDQFLRITHTHSIKNGIMNSAVVSTVNSWQDVDPNNSHTHTIPSSSFGNTKTIYSVLENEAGDLLLGTSDGLMVQSPGVSYRIYVNYHAYEFVETDLKTAIYRAEWQYIDDTGDQISFPESEYEWQITAAEAELTSVGDSYVFEGKTPLSAVVIPIAYVDSFFEDTIVTRSNLYFGETLVRSYKVDLQNLDPDKLEEEFNNDAQAILDLIAKEGILSSGEENESVTVYKVRKNYQDRVVWGMLFVDSEKIAMSTQQGPIIGSLNKQWVEASRPTSVSNCGDLALSSSGDMWLASNKSLLLSRGSSGYLSFGFGSSDLSGNVRSLVSVGPETFAAVFPSGVRLVSERGSTVVDALLVPGLATVTRDYRLDKTSEDSDHYHTFDVNRLGNGVTSLPLTNGDPYVGPNHTHDVSSWTVSIASGHVHDLITTLYAATDSGVIYKSSDSGETWSLWGNAPQGEIGVVFAAFGKVFVPMSDSLKSSSDGMIWTDAMQARISGSGWTWDFDGFYVGGDNFVWKTTNGTSFTQVVSLSGSPVSRLLLDGVQKDFGYACNNKGYMFLRQGVVAGTQVQARLSYDVWVAQKGGWDSTKPYDIYIDGKRVISTANNIDRRTELGLDFTIDPLSGILSFAKYTTISQEGRLGDTTLNMASTSGFSANSEILVYPSSESSELTIIRLQIQSVDSPTIVSLSKPLTVKIGAQSIVTPVSVRTSSMIIHGYFYDSWISDGGTNTHDAIEDSLSVESSGQPYRMSEAGIRNLSEIVLAVKYALPSVDEKLKNWASYMMRYDSNPSDPDYIGNYFDLPTTYANGESLYNSPKSPFVSSSVNSVAIGYGNLSGYIFSGTDVGLFYATMSPGLESNWIYVNQCPAGSIYSILILKGTHIMVAGSEGLYKSLKEDMTRWEEIASSLVRGRPTKFIGLRWENYTEGDRYWWNSWDGMTNLVNSDLTNIIMAGGQGFLIYSSDEGSSWFSANLPFDPELSSVTISSLKALPDGSAFLAANGNSGASNTYILRTTYAEGPWIVVESYSGYVGTVLEIEPDNATNTKVTISFTYPNLAPNIKDNSLIGLFLTSGDRSWLIASNSGNSVCLQGTVAADKIKVGYPVMIVPQQINTFVYTRTGEIFAGTNVGLMTDMGSATLFEIGGGNIKGVNKYATVTAVDISGSIDGILQQEETTVLSCTLDRIVAPNELVDQNLIIIDSAIPSVSILSPTPNEVFTSSSVKIVVAPLSFEPGSSGYIAYQMDGGDISYLASSLKTFNDLTNGNHTIKVFLTDLNKKAITGSQTTASISFSIAQDSTAPSVQILYPSQNQVLQTSTFNAVIKLNNFNPVTDGSVWYQQDGLPAVLIPTSSSDTKQVTLTGLIDGSHSLRTYLTDTSGSIIDGTSVQHNFTISATITPAIAITSPITGVTMATSSVLMQYSITNFSVPTDGFVRISVDGTPSVTSQDPVFANIYGLSEGSHIIAAELVKSDGTSPSGNFYKSQITIIVDTSSVQTPRVFITSPASGTNYSSGTRYVDISFTTSAFDIPEDGGVIIASNGISSFYQYPSSYSFPVSGDGSYQITLTLANSATQKLTNPEALASVSFSVGTATRSGREIISSPNIASPNITSYTPTRNNSNLQSAKTPDISARDEVSVAPPSWSIAANSAGSSSGAATITVQTAVSSDYIGKRFKIVGKSSSTLYVTFAQPVATGEFNSGIVYIDSAESFNAGKSYSIKYQDDSTLTLGEVINPLPTQENEVVPDVYPGQVIRMIPSSSNSTFYVEFNHPWQKNELIGEAVRIDSVSSLQSYIFYIVGNTSRSLELSGDASPQLFSEGDIFYLATTVFIPLKGFSHVRTTEDLDHYHNTDLIGNLVTGSTASLTLASASLVDVYVSDTSNFNVSAVQSNPTLLDGATIIFYNPSNPAVVYEEIIDSVSPTKITVKVSKASHWNLNDTNPSAISPGFKWEVDARLYGFTSGVNHKGLIVARSKLSSNAAIGSDMVNLESTSGMLVGDKVEITSSDYGVFTSEIVSFPSPGWVKLADILPHDYLVTKDATLIVRRDSYPESHYHLIKAGEVYSQRSSIYSGFGYPYEHNHVLANLVENVQTIRSDEAGTLQLSGSDSKVYRSLDYGQSWTVLVDTADVSEGASVPDNIPSMTVDSDGNLFLGTSAGYVVAQVESEPPTVQDLDWNEFDVSSSSSSWQEITLHSGMTYSVYPERELDIIFDGAEGTSANLVIAGISFKVGNVSGNFVWDVDNEFGQYHTFTRVGEVISVVVEGKTYTITWRGFGSLIFTVNPPIDETCNKCSISQQTGYAVEISGLSGTLATLNGIHFLKRNSSGECLWTEYDASMEDLAAIGPVLSIVWSDDRSRWEIQASYGECISVFSGQECSIEGSYAFDPTLCVDSSCPGACIGSSSAVASVWTTVRKPSPRKTLLDGQTYNVGADLVKAFRFVGNQATVIVNGFSFVINNSNGKLIWDVTGGGTHIFDQQETIVRTIGTDYYISYEGGPELQFSIASYGNSVILQDAVSAESITLSAQVGLYNGKPFYTSSVVTTNSRGTIQVDLRWYKPSTPWDQGMSGFWMITETSYRYIGIDLVKTGEVKYRSVDENVVLAGSYRAIIGTFSLDWIVSENIQPYPHRMKWIPSVLSESESSEEEEGAVYIRGEEENGRPIYYSNIRTLSLTRKPLSGDYVWLLRRKSDLGEAGYRSPNAGTDPVRDWPDGSYLKNGVVIGEFEEMFSSSSSGSSLSSSSDSSLSSFSSI